MSLNKKPEIPSKLINEVGLYVPFGITDEEIMIDVIKIAGITHTEMCAMKWTKIHPACYAVKTICFLCYVRNGNSYRSIGSLVGGKKHSTVIHHINDMCNLIDPNMPFYFNKNIAIFYKKCLHQIRDNYGHYFNSKFYAAKNQAPNQIARLQS